jgi:hypothetical protein
MGPLMIDTRTAPRRTLRFDTLAGLRAELDRLDAAHRAGTLRATGNWSPGRILAHLAAWIEYPYSGFPMRSSILMRLLGRLAKRSILHAPFKPGFRFRAVPSGTYGQDEMPFPEALSRLRTALDTLETRTPPLPSPVFGPLSHEEWIRLHLSHAELHLGFLNPSSAT